MVQTLTSARSVSIPVYPDNLSACLSCPSPAVATSLSRSRQGRRRMHPGVSRLLSSGDSLEAHLQEREEAYEERLGDGGRHGEAPLGRHRPRPSRRHQVQLPQSHGQRPQARLGFLGDGADPAPVAAVPGVQKAGEQGAGTAVYRSGCRTHGSRLTA